MHVSHIDVSLLKGEKPFKLTTAIDDKRGAFVDINSLKEVYKRARMKVLSSEELPDTQKESFLTAVEWNLDVLDAILRDFYPVETR